MQNFGDSKRASGCEGLWGGGNRLRRARRIFRAVNYFVWYYNNENSSLCIFHPLECVPPRMNPNVSV
jgi:hypothetical protein